MIQLPALQTINKSQIKQHADKFLSKVIDEGLELETIEVLNAMEGFIKELKGSEEMRGAITDAVAKYGKTYTSPSGTKIDLAEVGTSYDFSNCGDIELLDLYSDLEEIKGQIKGREEMLKTLKPEGLEILRGDELIHVYPPVKRSTSSYKVTLKK